MTTIGDFAQGHALFNILRRIEELEARERNLSKRVAEQGRAIQHLREHLLHRKFVADWTELECENVSHHIPAGATPVWNPPRIRTEWRLSHAREFHEDRTLRRRIFNGWLPGRGPKPAL